MDNLDKPRESAEQKAKRQWGNYDLTKRFKETVKENQLAALAKSDELKPGDVLTTERPKADVTTKFERQFIKELREMLEGHTQRNVAAYKAAIQAQLYRLKREKLRRLQAGTWKLAQPKSKDLF